MSPPQVLRAASAGLDDDNDNDDDNDDDNDNDNEQPVQVVNFISGGRDCDPAE